MIKGIWGRTIAGATVGMAMLGSAFGAMAADLSPVYKAPAAPVVSEPSPWMIRVRALGVLPAGGGHVNGVAGSSLSYSDSVVPELDISYFFTKNIAAELILGVTPHNIYGAGTLGGLNVGKVWLLPPTLTLQYHFTDFGAFKPYVGVGVNYTVFFNTKTYDTQSLDVKNTFGWAVQAGFDYMIDKHWGVNVDIKKLFLEPDFTVGVGNAVLTGTADLNPWIVGGGVTYRF
ncbi:OmpW/AlkL family protein [Aquabacter cavernae]|uniref:OmpW/AlkL family protein n=1 Tax=Aquabacter cavernae TaxID=2496029 RepID=UPI001FDECABE|nr:OmpW family protein [Aquabacter cavernae]